MTRRRDAGHERWLEAVSARVDREDTAVVAPDLAEHLAACPGCRAFEAVAARQRRASRIAPVPPIPDLTRTIHQRIPARRRRAGTAARVLGRVAAALVMVAGGGAAGWTLSSHHARTTAAAPTRAFPGAVVLTDRTRTPDVVLTDTSGRPYSLAKATAGRVTLLYFGATDCGDPCPLSVAAAADAVSSLPSRLRARVAVVFVTTDPGRDRPAVVGRWLHAVTAAYPGARDVVGLTGTTATIRTAEREAGVAVWSGADAGKGRGPRYGGEHAGYTLAFAADGRAVLQIGADEPVADYRMTLVHLIAGGTR